MKFLLALRIGISITTRILRAGHAGYSGLRESTLTASTQDWGDCTGDGPALTRWFVSTSPTIKTIPARKDINLHVKEVLKEFQSPQDQSRVYTTNLGIALGD